MTRRVLRRRLLQVGMAGGGILLVLLVAVSVWIRHDVDVRCHAAQHRYGGDCVTALMTLLDDEDQDFTSRNGAIWALGQLDDRRALPTLRSYYTGHIPAHEPWNATISQYELKKAIRHLNGEFNITRPFG